MNETYLIHHGIDGQKWGVQNGPPYPLDKSKYSMKEKRALKKAVKDVKRSRKNANKYKVLMSDKEIEDRNKRLENEKKLNKLTNPGKSFVSDFMKQNGGKAAAAVAAPGIIFVGKKIATKYGKYETAELLEKIIKNMVSPKK